LTEGISEGIYQRMVEINRRIEGKGEGIDQLVEGAPDGNETQLEEYKG
jgi:hypothetical protein